MRRSPCCLSLLLACTGPAPASEPAPAREPAPASEPEPESAAPVLTPEPAPAKEPQRPELTPGAPVTAVALSRHMGKPPLRFYGLRLTLENRHKEPIWLMFASDIDDPLPAADTPDASIVRFPGTARSGVQFSGRGYPQQRREVIDVQLLADPGFHAYRLPPHARVVLDGASFDGSSDVDRMDVWEVRDILVNGEQPLEQWLPYPVTSRAGVTVRDFADWENLDWDPARRQSRKDYPKEPVTHVTAEVLRRWVIPLRDIEKLGPTR